MRKIKQKLTISPTPRKSQHSKNGSFSVKIECDIFDGTVSTQYTQSVLIRNGPIRNTSEIFGFLKK